MSKKGMLVTDGDSDSLMFPDVTEFIQNFEF